MILNCIFCRSFFNNCPISIQNYHWKADKLLYLKIRNFPATEIVWGANYWISMSRNFLFYSLPMLSLDPTPHIGSMLLICFFRAPFPFYIIITRYLGNIWRQYQGLKMVFNHTTGTIDSWGWDGDPTPPIVKKVKTIHVLTGSIPLEN